MGPRALPGTERTEREWHDLHSEWIMLYMVAWEVECGEAGKEMILGNSITPLQAQHAFERVYPEWRWRRV